MMMSNLPKDLLEEILSRVPFKYLREVRSTCKKWNALSKDRSFGNKHIDKAAVSGEKEFLMVTAFSVYLIGVNLHRTQNNNFDLSIKRKGKLVSLDSSDKVFYRSDKVIQCNGVFLCLWGYMLVLWSPYWGKTKWTIPRNTYGGLDMYALGYDNSSGSHKILRFFGNKQKNLDIYDLRSNSWMVPDGTLERDIHFMNYGVSLKGNTYWYARDKGSTDRYLFCFDFTRERFGPRLPLPFIDEGYASLTAVKEEQLAVLTQAWDIMGIKIWVTNKIEPYAVSWSIFLKVDMMPSFGTGNFLIDEEKKVAVVFEKDDELETIYNNAYIIGENNYFRRVDLRKSPYTPLCQLVPYVPSSAQIK